MRKKLIIITILGLFLRLFLAASTFHSDVQPFYFAGEVIAKGNVLNFYDYLGNLPADDPILKVYPVYLFNYPPVVYFSLGLATHLLTAPFEKGLLQDFIINFRNVLGRFDLNVFLLTLKLPYLPFDLLLGVILYKFFKVPKEKILAFGLWIFNPFNLYSTYIMGQFDVIPTFFVLLAMYLLVRKNNLTKSNLVLPAVVIGLGASFKIYPFLFLVPLALLKTGWAARLKIIAVGFVTYILLIMPFIGSPGFRQTALLAGQTMKSFYASIAISGGESIILFPLLVLFFYIRFLYVKNYPEDIWRKFFVVLLLFFAFTHYHPQWFLWLTPFLIIDLVKSKLSHWPLVALSSISFLGLLTFFDPGLTVWLFAPLFPQLYGMAGIWELLGVNVDINFARSLLQTLFVSVALYYVYYYDFSTASHSSR